jgi:uracil-DNA glycosylase
VASFEEFRTRFVLTDALRCHCTGPRVPERALAACAKFMPEEFRLFPNLSTILTLGEDAYLQFQRNILGRKLNEVKAFHERLGDKGWAEESATMDSLSGRKVRVIYAHHPTLGYKRSPALAALFA